MDNVFRFGEIMKEMKIEVIYGEDGYNDIEGEEFELFVDKFGPGGIYKTIAFRPIYQMNVKRLISQQSNSLFY